MRYGKLPILRHKSNNKWFGVIFYLNETLYINLKAEPETISILKDQYPESVTSAWHMNKSHWCKAKLLKSFQKKLNQLSKRKVGGANKLSLIQKVMPKKFSLVQCTD